MGATDSSKSQKPELQIWQKTGETSYTKMNFSQLSSSTPIGNVVEYNLSTPLEFQEGDILGVFLPMDAALVVYYQECDGPVNYKKGGGDSLSSVTLDNPDYKYDYPLVTVEISTSGIMLISCIKF